jgi:6-phosphogluconolactonase
MNNKIIKIFPIMEDISNFLINEWVISQNNSLHKKKYFTVALSGGNTPIPFYQKLSEIKNKFNWKKTFIFLVDERHVPYDHIDNNYKMIKENLINKINIPEINLFPINTHLSIEESAIDYENCIVDFFKKKEIMPGFDIIFLGIGNDGHTASLFPGSNILNEKEKLVLYVEAKNIIHKRITITLPLINNSKKIIFLATGENKSQIIKEIIEDKNKNYPASLVYPKDGTILFVLDKEAGKKLKIIDI